MLFTATGTGDLRLASLFWLQPQWVALDGVSAGQVGQARPCLKELVSLRVSVGTLLGFWAQAEKQRRVSEHKRYPLEEPLVEQGRGAELWSAPSRNGSSKKWRRKSREMVMFTRAHPSQRTRSTKMSPTPSGKAAWVEETHLAKPCLPHPTLHGNVAGLFACPRSLLADLPDFGVNWLLGPPQHSHRCAPCQLPALCFPRYQPTLTLLGSACDLLCRMHKVWVATLTGCPSSSWGS